MTTNRPLYSTFHTSKSYFVPMGENSQAEVQGYGDIELKIIRNEKRKTYSLEDLLYAPDLHYSLISVETLCAN